MIKWLPRILFIIVLILGFQIVYDWMKGRPDDPVEEGWILYTAPEDLFEVQFPHEPRVTKDSFALLDEDEMKFHVYVAFDKGERGYIVRVVHYGDSPNVGRPDFLYQVAYQILNVEREALLRDIVETPIQGYPGITFTVREGELVQAHRAVQRGKTVYLITHADVLSRYEPLRFDRFVETFTLLD